MNFVSKDLQSDTTDLATGLSSFQNLLKWLNTYKEHGFTDALIDAKELAQELDVEPVFKAHRLRRRRGFFDDESVDEPESDPELHFQMYLLLFDFF